MRYLPPDISYCIESAAELGDIMADVARFFYDFNDRNIAQEHDDLELDLTDTAWDAHHRRYADFYTQVYEEWYYERATDAQRAWCIRAAAERFRQVTAETVDYIYRHYVSARLATNHEPMDRNAIQAYLGQNRKWVHARKNVAQL